jgi:hypothetical protein
MGTILKKSQRVQSRFKVHSICQITTRAHRREFATVCDISPGGVGIAFKDPILMKGERIDVFFKNDGIQPLHMKGEVVSLATPIEHRFKGIRTQLLRYAVRFDSNLTEKQFQLLLSIFNLQNPELY